jgi:uncharacterized protein YndB with AHSA1/START domain
VSEPIVITRTFAASRERVFDAWTTPSDFSAWFGTAEVEVPLDTLRMDVRSGGAWSAVTGTRSTGPARTSRSTGRRAS